MTTTPKHRLRWYQYSLRSLFVLTVLVAVAGSWFAVKRQQKERERAAVRWVVEMGGVVGYDYQCDANLRYISNAEPPGPSWVRAWLGDDFFAHAAVLALNGTNLTDREVKHLKALTQLRLLIVSHGAKVNRLSPNDTGRGCAAPRRPTKYCVCCRRCTDSWRATRWSGDARATVLWRVPSALRARNRQRSTDQESGDAAPTIGGSWICRDLPPFGPEWQTATTCEMFIRELTPEEKELQGDASGTVFYSYPDRADFDVAMYLSNSYKRWRLPDTPPGWIDRDGRIWLGPIGSALMFKPTLRADGKLVLEHRLATFVFERQNGE